MKIPNRVDKLFAVVGYPLGHTLSPSMHMAALKKRGIPGLYIPLEIEPREFVHVMKDIRRVPLSGFNVTVPFKEKIIPLLDNVSPEARAIGAVNTVKVGKDIVGYNTDACGFERSLRDDLGFSPKGKRALLIGAGGAARACMYTLAKRGIKTIVIADTVSQKAVRLRNHFQRIFKKVQFIITKANEEHYELFLPEVDLIINATPVGLRKNDPLLIPGRIFPEKKLAVYDLIYNPAQTKLLTVAKKKGCRTAHGLGMLLYQGAKAFEIWTRTKAPVSTMRRALLQGLKKKK